MPAPDRREVVREIMAEEAEWWFSPEEGGEQHQAATEMSKWAGCPRVAAAGGPLLCAFMGTFSNGVQP